MDNAERLKLLHFCMLERMGLANMARSCKFAWLREAERAVDHYFASVEQVIYHVPETAGDIKRTK